MSDGYAQDPLPGVETRCEFESALTGEYCGQAGEVGLDGLWLCGRHADRLRLQERASYWRAILAHVDLWSGEARRRGREDVVGLLRVERARASDALVRASRALQSIGDGKAGTARMAK